MIQTPNIYVNDIVLNNVHINRIYNKGEIYWGNQPAPPTRPNYVCGYANSLGTFTNQIKINGIWRDITTDENGYWEIDLGNELVTELTENILYYALNGQHITVLDLRHVIYDESSFSFGNMFVSVTPRNLTDIYFDFTGVDTTHCIGGAWFRYLSGTHIHGLGTFKWSGPIDVSNGSTTNNFTWREFNAISPSILGTFDIRGYDSTSITEQYPNSPQVKVASFKPHQEYGIWYNAFKGAFDTMIIGKLEKHYVLSSYNRNNAMTTLYCTSPIPPSLDRTGAQGMVCLNWLQDYPNLANIYVPTGCLSVYQNASTWSNYAHLMSEREAPDPLTI